MTKESKILLGLIAIGTGCYVRYLHVKLNKVEEMIDVAVDEVSSNIKVNISEDMLDLAVQKAIDREVSYIGNIINRDISMEIRSQVKKSVDISSNDIKSSVTRELERQVKNIDISDMEREVVERAKDAVAEKFDKKLDRLLEEYNANLQNVQKIYSSIAKSITKD